MFLANFRTALSWITKQPLYYLVKVLGLALGLVAVALLVTYVNFVQSYDAHIAKREQIYRVVDEYVSRENGARVRDYLGSNAWIEPFKQEYAGLYDELGVVLRRNGVFGYETTVFDQEYYYAEPSILSLFSIKVLQGDPANALVGPNKVLLSEAAAVKYFGSATDAIGKTLRLDQLYDLEVSGIFQDLPPQTSFPMQALVSYDTTQRLLSGAMLNNQFWLLTTGHTMFVSFQNPETARTVNADLAAIPYRRSAEQDIPILQRNQFILGLQPLTEIYLDPRTGGTSGDDFTRRNTYFGMWILSLLVIAGASVNYISLTLGQLQLRTKELGVRTAFGATKHNLVMQLITESLAVSGPALLLSAVLLELLVPVFSAAVAVPMTLADMLRPQLWGWLALAVLALCALVNASPALFTSQSAIKQQALRPRGSRFSWKAASSVIFFQFALSTLAALLVLGIYLQVNLLQEVDIGLDPDNLAVLDTRYQTNSDASGFEAFKNELRALPEVQSVAALSAMPTSTTAFNNWIRLAEGTNAGEPIEQTVTFIQVDPEFLDTYRIPLLAGRNFSLDYPSELFNPGDTDLSGRNLGIVITRGAARRFGFASPEDAVGQSFRYTQDQDDRRYT
ncbi:MAG: ABC transporter permease, partial [Pseudomonadales bacterium]|nr:ABC transporter permease [Pseudomonadales bacterium]